MHRCEGCARHASLSSLSEGRDVRLPIDLHYNLSTSASGAMKAARAASTCLQHELIAAKAAYAADDADCALQVLLPGRSVEHVCLPTAASGTAAHGQPQL